MLKKRIICFGIIPLLVLTFSTCRISYSFTGSSIDYNVVKTISISDFPNQASLISPTLSANLTDAIKDKFIRQTRLEMVNAGGDLEIEGEITGYNESPMSVQEDGHSTRTKLTITIRVRYYNRAEPDKDFETTFSAYQDYDSNTMLQSIQEQIDGEIIEELVDQIYNSTVADW